MKNDWLWQLKIYEGKYKVNKSDYQNWSAHDWYDSLFNHYFTATSAKNNHPVTYLSVTETALAQLVDESSDQADIVFQSFRKHLPKTLQELESIFQMYENRQRIKFTASYPNIISIKHNIQHQLILIFSCLVACTDPEPDTRRSQYPERMQSLLGFEHTPQKLSGLASMWLAFKAYLDERHKQNPLSRCLVLPDPGNETRIGYSKRLAFPEMRDRQRLREKLKDVDTSALSPDLVAKIFSNLEISQYSESFKKAYRDFEYALSLGCYGSSIRNTKFYDVINAIVAEETFDRDTQEYTQVHIHLFYDLHGNPYLEVIHEGNAHEIPQCGDGKINPQWLLMFGCSASKFFAPELLRALKSGIFFFSQLSEAHWRWSPIPSKDTNLKVLIDTTLVRVEPIYNNKAKSLFRNWVLLDLELLEVVSFLSSVQKYSKHMDGAISLIGAARVGQGYLLNSISDIKIGVLGADKVTYRPQDQDWSSLKHCEEDIWGPFIAAKGKVLVRAHLESGVFRHRKFQAHQMALIHTELAVPNKRYHYVHSETHQNVPSLNLNMPDTGKFECTLSDFLEVIYAEGRYGLSESEIIGWIRRAYPNKPVSRWHVLQCLVDAGWLQEAYMSHWPSRIFFLRSMTCIIQSTGENCYRLHFDGALPKALRERIRVVLNDNGITMKVGNSISPFAPPPLYAEVSQSKAKVIANKLGVPLENITLTSIPETPIDLNATMEVLRTWCWSKGQFIETSQVKTPYINGVRLDKLRFNAQHGMDRYQVRSGDCINQYFLPQIAIRAAYLKASKPLFELNSGELVCLTQQPAMSVELARFWKLQSLTSSGPVEKEPGVYQYIYSCPDEAMLSQCQNLKQLLSLNPPDIPFWMRAYAFRVVAEGDQVRLCEQRGLITPETNII